MNKQNDGVYANRVLTAIRIFNDNRCTPYADLYFSNGDREVVQFNISDNFDYVMKYSTAYTLFYDEREKREWSEWGKEK